MSATPAPVGEPFGDRRDQRFEHSHLHDLYPDERADHRGHGVACDRTDRDTKHSLLDQLTDGELEVLTCVAKGWSNSEIAESLFVTPATAKTHVARLLPKLHARDRAHLIVTAYESGLVTPRPPRRD